MRKSPLRAFASPLKQDTREEKVKKIDKYSKQSLSKKVDMAQHISGIRPNLRGEMFEYKRKKYLKSLDK